MDIEKLSQEEINRRLGTDALEPELCALTGQPVQGRHSVGYKVPGTSILYRVLAKHHDQWIDAKRKAFEVLVAPKAAIKKTELKEGDK